MNQAPLFTVLLSLAVTATSLADQRKFMRPEEAMPALVDAVRSGDQEAMLAVLGPQGAQIISSGDPVADKNARDRVVAAAKEKTRYETLRTGEVIVHVGEEDWPLPIPLVKDGGQWRFDTEAGLQEVLNRRIGRNELKAIAASRAYVDAQRERQRLEADYAQKIRSASGTHDGLYWDDPTGKKPSPLGPLFAEASAEGYGQNPSGEPQPYHGYYYRILTEQGPSAPGGAMSFLENGKMTGGFALVAWPAEYESSGVMTFIVGPQGIVYQKNLGEKTAEMAKAMKAYDPDDSWHPTRD